MSKTMFYRSIRKKDFKSQNKMKSNDHRHQTLLKKIMFNQHLHLPLIQPKKQKCHTEPSQRIKKYTNQDTIKSNDSDLLFNNDKLRKLNSNVFLFVHQDKNKKKLKNYTEGTQLIDDVDANESRLKLNQLQEQGFKNSLNIIEKYRKSKLQQIQQRNSQSKVIKILPKRQKLRNYRFSKEEPNILHSYQNHNKQMTSKTASIDVYFDLSCLQTKEKEVNQQSQFNYKTSK